MCVPDSSRGQDTSRRVDNGGKGQDEVGKKKKMRLERHARTRSCTAWSHAESWGFILNALKATGGLELEAACSSGHFKTLI